MSPGVGDISNARREIFRVTVMNDFNKRSVIDISCMSSERMKKKTVEEEDEK